jgi:hypothetical protein
VQVWLQKQIDTLQDNFKETTKEIMKRDHVGCEEARDKTKEAIGRWIAQTKGQVHTAIEVLKAHGEQEKKQVIKALCP